MFVLQFDRTMTIDHVLKMKMNQILVNDFQVSHELIRTMYEKIKINELKIIYLSSDFLLRIAGPTGIW